MMFLSPNFMFVVLGVVLGIIVGIWVTFKLPELFLLFAIMTNFLSGLFIPGLSAGEFGIVPYMLFTIFAFIGYGFQILTGRRHYIKPVGYVFLLLFIVTTTVSLLVVQDFRVAIGLYARTVFQWIVFFLLVQLLIDQKSVSRLVRVLLIQAVIVVAWGIISGVQMNYFGVIEIDSFFWTQYQKNDFATYLAVILTLALATLIVKAKRIDKILALILIPMVPIAWMFTFSRGGFLSIIVSLSVFIILIRSRVKLKRLSFWIVLFIVLGVAGIAMLPSNARILAIDGLTSILNPERANIERNQRTVAIRLVLAETALEVIAKNPVLGVGFNQWEFYSPLKTLRYEPQLGEYVETGVSVHNRYLGIAANSGLLALMFYLIFLMILFLHGVKLIFSSGNQYLKVYLAASLAALIGIQISLQLTPTIIWEWPIFGLVAGLINTIELEKLGLLPNNRWIKIKTSSLKSPMPQTNKIGND